MLDMSGTRGMTDPARTAGGKWNEGRLFQWPNAPRNDDINAGADRNRDGVG